MPIPNSHSCQIDSLDCPRQILSCLKILPAMNSSKLKTMQIILAAFCFSQISFALVTLMLNQYRIFLSFSASVEDAGLFPLFPILGLVFIGMSTFMFKKQVSGIPKEATADEKITGYQTAFIIRCAFLEGASLINIVGFLISGNLAFLFIAAIALTALIFSRPTRERIIDALTLSYPDTEKL